MIVVDALSRKASVPRHNPPEDDVVEVEVRSLGTQGSLGLMSLIKLSLWTDGRKSASKLKIRPGFCAMLTSARCPTSRSTARETRTIKRKGTPKKQEAPAALFN